MKHMQPVSMSETAVIAADDDRVNSFALQKYAERLGCPITLAGDGQELLELMKRRPYQLVLMDIEMPRMDGVEATRRIRAGEGGEANRAVPVIAMTAHSSGDFTKKLRDAGMDGFLGKPIVFEDFANLVARYANLEGGGIPVLDRGKALSRVGGDSAHLRGLEGIFLEDVPRRMEELMGAMGRGDVEGVRRAAHSVKGASLAIGAERCAGAASALEAAAAAGESARIRGLFDRMERELDFVIRAITPPEGNAR